MAQTGIRYVAIGDSYTIGTSVGATDRWPDQLVAWLRAHRVSGFELAANLAVNGFTARDVLEAELPRLRQLQPGFVSLLVGVNDVIQGVPEATYRQQVGRILAEATAIVGTDRCLFVTTPDYTVTPAGADYGNPAEVSAAIRRFNAAAIEVAGQRAVTVVDIHDLSLRATADRRLVARDGLHPSGSQYSLWVDRIGPVVCAMLETQAGMSPSGY